MLYTMPTGPSLKLIWTQDRTQQKKRQTKGLGHMAQFVSWNPNSLRDCSAANTNREVKAENEIAPTNPHGHRDSATKRSHFCREATMHRTAVTQLVRA